MGFFRQEYQSGLPFLSPITQVDYKSNDSYFYDTKVGGGGVSTQSKSQEDTEAESGVTQSQGKGACSRQRQDWFSLRAVRGSTALLTPSLWTSGSLSCETMNFCFKPRKK